MENKMNNAAKSQFYQELRGYLDKGMTLQYVEIRKRNTLRSNDFEPPVYWKRTHGESIDRAWAEERYTAHLPRGRSHV